MNKETKRSITYTSITILLVIVSLINGNEESSLVSYTCGLLSFLVGVVAIINIIDAIKSRNLKG